MIISRAPVRISFGGGGTDMESYYNEYGGLVISTTINKYIYAIFNIREDDKIQLISSDFQAIQTVDDFYSLRFGEEFDIPNAVIKYFKIHQGFDLFIASEIPPGTGLGTSGALTVNLINLFAHAKNKKMTKQQVAETAYFIQRHILNLPIGKQDEYAASFGRLNIIEFRKDGVAISPVRIKEKSKKILENNTMLFFTGKTRKSSKILTQQETSILRKDREVIDALAGIKKITLQMKDALENSGLSGFGKLLDTAWAYKKKMNKDITNQRIDRLYDLAIDSGALGGKISGAGGGGYFMFYCEPEHQNKLKKVLEAEGLKNMDYRFDDRGVNIVSEGD